MRHYARRHPQPIPRRQRGGVLEDSRREIGIARAAGEAGMTAGESIALRVAKALEVCGILFLLTGSFASNYYGIPRSTRDADFVLQSQHAVGPDFAKELGEDFLLEPQLSFETNTRSEEH